MRIEFDDGSYIEIVPNDKKSDSIFITITAKDVTNPQKTIVNSVEINYDQLKLLINNLVVVEAQNKIVSDNTEISASIVEKRGRGRPKKTKDNNEQDSKDNN